MYIHTYKQQIPICMYTHIHIQATNTYLYVSHTRHFKTLTNKYLSHTNAGSASRARPWPRRIRRCEDICYILYIYISYIYISNISNIVYILHISCVCDILNIVYISHILYVCVSHTNAGSASWARPWPRRIRRCGYIYYTLYIHIYIIHYIYIYIYHIYWIQNILHISYIYISYILHIVYILHILYILHIYIYHIYTYYIYHIITSVCRSLFLT